MSLQEFNFNSDDDDETNLSIFPRPITHFNADKKLENNIRKIIRLVLREELKSFTESQSKSKNNKHKPSVEQNKPFNKLKSNRRLIDSSYTKQKQEQPTINNNKVVISKSNPVTPLLKISKKSKTPLDSTPIVEADPIIISNESDSESESNEIINTNNSTESQQTITICSALATTTNNGSTNKIDSIDKLNKNDPIIDSQIENSTDTVIPKDSIDNDSTDKMNRKDLSSNRRPRRTALDAITSLSIEQRERFDNLESELNNLKSIVMNEPQVDFFDQINESNHQQSDNEHENNDYTNEQEIEATDNVDDNGYESYQEDIDAIDNVDESDHNDDDPNLNDQLDSDNDNDQDDDQHTHDDQGDHPNNNDDQEDYDGY